MMAVNNCNNIFRGEGGYTGDNQWRVSSGRSGQAVEAAPCHQGVYLPRVGRLITIRDESNEGGVIRKLQ